MDGDVLPRTERNTHRERGVCIDMPCVVYEKAANRIDVTRHFQSRTSDKLGNFKSGGEKPRPFTSIGLLMVHTVLCVLYLGRRAREEGWVVVKNIGLGLMIRWD